MISILAGLAAGILLGGIIGWLLGSRKNPVVAAPADDRLLEEIRGQLKQRESELSQTRENLTQASNAKATAQAQKDATADLLVKQQQLHEQNLRETKAAQDKALADLREVFKGLSAEALKQTQPEFLRMAEQSLGKFQESAKGDLEKRQESIKTLVEPLKQQLEVYQKRLQQSETTQAGVMGEVKKQLESLAVQSLSLANETQQFRMVLHSNQARGRWGEETLRRVVEAAGMSAHCDFSEQTQSGDSKPDLIVRLPGDRLIIVDAKVPDLDFLSGLNGADPLKRSESLAVHAAKLKETIKALGARDYPSQFANALDHVVLFLPAESLFSAALEGDQELIVWAASKRIMLATPASLIALLRSVSISWQQHAQSENAQKIIKEAQEFFLRVVTLAGHLKKIGEGLKSANEAFNQAVGSYDARILPQGEKLKKLGAGAVNKDMPEVPLLDTTLRLPPAA